VELFSDPLLLGKTTADGSGWHPVTHEERALLAALMSGAGVPAISGPGLRG